MRVIFVIVSTLFAGLISVNPMFGQESESPGTTGENPADTSIALPAANLTGDLSVEEAIHQRRSVREYSSAPLKLAEISQLVWAAQGITGSGGLRTAPSAGALYPLELYVVAGNVESLPAGIYHYIPQGHKLELVLTGDHRNSLGTAALGQRWVKDAPASLVISGVVQRTMVRYGERASQYMFMEAGHAAENVFLQALSCHLGSVMIGAFIDGEVADLIKMSEGEEPLAIIPVGR
ncbi:SagB/ThcOx family dehydrogenase [bacterium]|nr:SagB/ThcOx family dehydrogenase [candidate division CSSED10-310 bacterium]